MATTVLVRTSSGEVLKISAKGQSFDDRDAAVFHVLTDPTFTDGTVLREGGDGPLRVLGYAKIDDVGTVRNATQPEIDTFAGFETDDENQLDADQAVVYFSTHPRMRKMMVAFADILKDEINILRALHALPDRTLAQLKTAIESRIDKDD